VSLWNGAENHTKTDLTITSLYPLQIVRSYQSNSSYDSRLGYGWSFNHDRRLFEYPDDSVVIRYSCGQTMRFVRTGGAYITPLDGPQGDLVEHPDGTFEFTYYNGFRDKFDVDGRLVEAIHREGHRHEYLYEADGKLPLTGTSPYAVDPDQPMVVAYMPQLTRIQERSADGQLTGVFVDFVYDAATGRVRQAVGSDGRQITYTHDPMPGGLTRGNLIQVEGPDGLLWQYQYQSAHGNHLLTSMQQGASAPILNTYDADGRVIQQTHGLHTLDFDYPIPLAQTRVTRTIRDDQGNVVHSAVSTTHFDSDGYVTKHVDALGHEIRYFHDGSKDVDRVEWWSNSAGTLALERTVEYSHDAKGRLLSSQITLDSGETITKTWTYDGGWTASEQVVSSLEPAKMFRTEYTFIRDGQGRPLRVHQIREMGSGGTDRVTTHTYCDSSEIGQPGSTCPFEGLLKRVDGPRSDVSDLTTFTYYADTDTSGCGTSDGPCHRKGQLHTIINALNHEHEVLRYNLSGDVLRSKDVNGVITDFEYNARRWLTATKVRGTDPSTESDDLITTQAYDDNGNLLRRTTPDGSFTGYSYDARDRLVEINNSAGDRIVYTLDSEGNRLKQEYFDAADTRTRSSTSTFDPLNRQVTQATSAGEITALAYDMHGNLISQQDPIPGLALMTRQYDDLNRLTRVTDPNGGITQTSYNAINSITSVTDPNGHTTDYTYNAFGDLLQTDSPDSGTTTYTYDEAGNRITQTDARNVTANYSHDALNRLTDVEWPSDPTLNIHYLFDKKEAGAGRLYRMTDGSGSTTWDYDHFGRVTTKTQIVGATTLNLGYQYDDGGNLSAIVYPDGAVIEYGYDLAGRTRAAAVMPAGTAIALGLIDNLDYRPFGPVSGIDFAGGYPDQSRGYDLDGRPTSLTGPLARSYGTDPVGNITAITEGAETWNFAYDALYRLDTVTDPQSVAVEEFDYDANGNRTGHDGVAYQIDPASNRLMQRGGITYQYDAMGNTTATTGDPEGNLSLTYGAHQRMLDSQKGQGLGSYRYNGHGERVRKAWSFGRGPTQVRVFLYDESGRLLGEYAENGAPVAQYVLADEVPVGVLRNGALHAIHTDHLTTPRAVTDASGTTIWRWESKAQPFGESAPDTDPDGDSTPFKFNLRFPGQYFDEETGLHYNYFRDYAPELGRYVQSDPVGLRGGLNTYSYSFQSPLKYIDPDGLNPRLWLAISCFIADNVDEAINHRKQNRRAGCRTIFVADMEVIDSSCELHRKNCRAGSNFALEQRGSFDQDCLEQCLDKGEELCQLRRERAQRELEICLDRIGSDVTTQCNFTRRRR